MQPVADSVRSRLEFLVQATGRGESELVAEALEVGLADLYRNCLRDAYLAGELERTEVIAELGAEAVEELDYAREAVRRDVAWGRGA